MCIRDRLDAVMIKKLVRIKTKNKWFATYRYSSPTIWLSKKLAESTTLYKDEEIIPRERAQEILLTNLRLTKGVNLKELFDNANISSLDSFINISSLPELQRLGLIKANKSTLKITNKGLPVLNSVNNKLLL